MSEEPEGIPNGNAEVVVEAGSAPAAGEPTTGPHSAAPTTAESPHYERPLSYLDIWERRRRRWRLGFGMALVAIGGGLFVLQFFGISWLGLLLVTPGVCLLAVCVAWRVFYPLLLAGAVLAGAGAGMIVDKALSVSVSLGLVGFGAGFIAAFAVQRLRHRAAHWWPLVPGVLFVAWGLFIGNPYRWEIITYGWPLLIVTAGAVVLVGALLRGRRPRSSASRSVDFPMR